MTVPARAASNASPVVDVLTDVGEAEARAVWAVSEQVFGDHTAYDAWWSSTWDRHVGREDFRLARARVGAPGQERLVGFGYGYTGRPRQWWSDRAAEVLGPDVAACWLGGHFELVTLAVLPGHRAHGLGGRLLAALTDGLPHRRRLLMTDADPADPARRLYARHGWQVIGPGFTGNQVILGWAEGADPG